MGGERRTEQRRGGRVERERELGGSGGEGGGVESGSRERVKGERKRRGEGQKGRREEGGVRESGRNWER